MVNIDTVYQKVLALANKEQRGYITPQEFNLLADKAQMDIINNYFHAEKMAQLKPKNQTESSDVIEMIQEKLAFLMKETSVSILSAGATTNSSFKKYIELPTEVYKIASLITKSTSSPLDNNEIEEVTNDRLTHLLNNPLASPTLTRPVYVNDFSYITTLGTQSVRICIYPTTTVGQVRIKYYKKPPSPNWAYVVASKKALYNMNNSVHFELHPIEEETLVTRILQLAGVAMQREDITQASLVDKQTIRQEQNS